MYLEDLLVTEEVRGKGLGKLLLQEVEKAAVANNNQSVFLNVNRYNNAVSFYKKQHYKIISEIDIEIGNGYLMEDYIMEMDLNK